MIQKFEVGKYYVCNLEKRDASWNCDGRMDLVLDKKPHKCIQSDGKDGATFEGQEPQDFGGVWFWKLGEFDEVAEKDLKKFKIKPVKVTPIEKHLILQDSCGNFVAIKNSEKEAIGFAKTYNKETLTIYKLIEVAKISTERKVSKVKTKWKK